MAEISYQPRPVRLPAAVVGLAAIAGRPRILAAACVVMLAALGWLYLGFSVGQMMETGSESGRGAWPVMRDLIAAGRWDLVGRQAVEALCLPIFDGGAGRHASAAWSGVDFGLVFAMWGAMALAMMLPSAAPMILTYSEIAETAAHKGERIVSPLVLTAGYVAVWLAFAFAAACVQILLARAALIDGRMASVSAYLSGAIFIAAGLYQFSTFKHACLRLCRRPFSFFFAHWTTQARGVFGLGVRQGLFCLGCCWAMMLVMFAVGTMNVVWMALMGALMALEKIVTTARLSHTVGVAFVATGLSLMIAA